MAKFCITLSAVVAFALFMIFWFVTRQAKIKKEKNKRDVRAARLAKKLKNYDREELKVNDFFLDK